GGRGARAPRAAGARPRGDRGGADGHRPRSARRRPADPPRRDLPLLRRTPGRHSCGRCRRCGTWSGPRAASSAEAGQWTFVNERRNVPYMTVDAVPVAAAPGVRRVTRRRLGYLIWVVAGAIIADP